MNVGDIENVIVIGCGGTGSALIPFLSRYLYSVNFRGNLVLADGDTYEESNSDRQIFNNQMVGVNKAEYQAASISNQLPEIEDFVDYIDEYLSEEDINGLVVENSIVINCVDNKAARKYVNDRVSSLNNAVHICCGNRERSGQVQAHVRVNGENVTPDIYEFSPEFDSTDDDVSSMSCEELAALPSGGQLICANMGAAYNALCMLMWVTSTRARFQDNHVPCGTIEYDCDTGNVATHNINELVM